MPPGAIIRGVRKRLGVRMRRHTFRHAEPAWRRSTARSTKATSWASKLQCSGLPYFPEDMRFHFNAHNLIVYGRDGGDYLVSDPVFEDAGALRSRVLDEGAVRQRRARRTRADVLPRSGVPDRARIMRERDPRGRSGRTTA